MNAKYPTIIEELRTVMYSIDDNAARNLAELIDASPRIFLSGAGRSGLMIRAFAMRIMHAGKEVHVLGDVTTPSAHAGDLLIIASGSGETESLVSHAKKAKKMGLKVATVTIFPEATIGTLSDIAVKINAPTPKSERESGLTSIQPMGSLFEQCMLLFLDETVMELMEIQGKTSDQLFQNHANLE